MKDNLFDVYCLTTHEENFQHSEKLSVERFAEPHSDWPKMFVGSQALVRGHGN